MTSSQLSLDKTLKFMIIKAHDRQFVTRAVSVARATRQLAQVLSQQRETVTTVVQLWLSLVKDVMAQLSTLRHVNRMPSSLLHFIQVHRHLNVLCLPFSVCWPFLSRSDTLERDIGITGVSVCLSVCLSVCHTMVMMHRTNSCTITPSSPPGSTRTRPTLIPWIPGNSLVPALNETGMDQNGEKRRFFD